MKRPLLKTVNVSRGQRVASPGDFQSQLDALNSQVDAQAAQIADLQSQLANKAILPMLQAYDQSISDPPTQDDLQKLADWANALLGELNGTGS